MANGSLEWFPPNRPATTFPEFHNLKGIPQEKSYLFVHTTMLQNILSRFSDSLFCEFLGKNGKRSKDKAAKNGKRSKDKAAGSLDILAIYFFCLHCLAR